MYILNFSEFDNGHNNLVFTLFHFMLKLIDRTVINLTQPFITPIGFNLATFDEIPAL